VFRDLTTQQRAQEVQPDEPGRKMPETGTRPRTAEQGALIRTACDHRNGSPGLGIEAFAFRRRLDLQSLVGRHPNIGQPRNQRTIILRPV
jgi:hypothetical protein